MWEPAGKPYLAGDGSRGRAEMAGQSHRIDIHHHIVPREYVEALAGIGVETPGRFPSTMG